MQCFQFNLKKSKTETKMPEKKTKINSRNYWLALKLQTISKFAKNRRERTKKCYKNCIKSTVILRRNNHIVKTNVKEILVYINWLRVSEKIDKICISRPGMGRLSTFTL